MSENVQETVDDVNNQYHEELLRNQEAENVVENISEQNEVSFSQEAVENKVSDQTISSDLKEFGVNADEPDLFSSDATISTPEDLLGSSDPDNDEDDLEIPAFLRRQKN